MEQQPTNIRGHRLGRFEDASFANESKSQFVFRKVGVLRALCPLFKPNSKPIHSL
jgi:hypothetical protein